MPDPTTPIHWRGSLTDMLTDLIPVSSPDERQRLAEAIINAPVTTYLAIPWKHDPEVFARQLAPLLTMEQRAAFARILTQTLIPSGVILC